MKHAYHNVHTLGRLNEITLQERDSSKDGSPYISGDATFLVNLMVSDIEETDKKSLDISNWEIPTFYQIYDLFESDNNPIKIFRSRSDDFFKNSENIPFLIKNEEGKLLCIRINRNCRDKKYPEGYLIVNNSTFKNSSLEEIAKWMCKKN